MNATDSSTRPGMMTVRIARPPLRADAISPFIDNAFPSREQPSRSRGVWRVAPARRYNPVMPANPFGERFRVTTAGVSHGPGYLVIIDGCPAGLPLTVDDLIPDLQRRRPGQSKIVTQRDEADLPEI